MMKSMLHTLIISIHLMLKTTSRYALVAAVTVTRAFLKDKPMTSISKKNGTSKPKQVDWLGRPVRSHAKVLAPKPPRPAKRGQK